MSEHQTEARLLDALVSGDKRAFEEFCSRLLPQLRYKICQMSRRYHFSEDRADDFTHTTLIRVLESYRPGSVANVIAWMTSIARNLIIDTWRHERRQHSLSEKQLDELNDTHLNNEQLLNEEVELLRECLSELSDSDRRVLELVMALKREEVAKTLGITLEATHKRYRRALTRLSNLMWTRNGPPSSK